MQNTCCGAAVTRAIRAILLTCAVAVISLVSLPAYAASIGHSRMLSGPGQPLRIELPLRELSPIQQQSLQVMPASEADWRQAGLVAPVDLSSLQVSLLPGMDASSRKVLVQSSQVFSGPVADLLLRIQTALGAQLYQVSVLSAHPDVGPVSLPSARAVQAGSPASGTGPAGVLSTSKTIQVKRGDTLFSLARANAVPGVSVYQMMVALLRANPQAFIQNNMNRLRAGAQLSLPDGAALTAVSDREARRIFAQQAQAFAAYRQGVASKSTAPVTAAAKSAQQGKLTQAPAPASPPAAAAGGDRVVLSSTNQDNAQDAKQALQHNIQESASRVQQLERNVQNLNQALQMQGEAAKEAALGGVAAVSQTLADAASSITGSGEAGTSAAGESSAAAVQNGVDAKNAAGVAGGVANDAANGAGAQGGASAQAGAASAQANGTSTQGAMTGQPDQAASQKQPSAQASASGASGQAQGQPDASAAAPSAASAPQSLSAGQPDTALAGTAASSAQSPGQPGGTAQGQPTDQPTGAAPAPAATSQADKSLPGVAVLPGSAASVGSSGAGSPSADSAARAAGSDSISGKKEEKKVSWLQDNMLIVITAILALMVLIIAWVLRRAAVSRSGDGQGGVTESMVQERLDQINLDLSDPANDTLPPR